MKASDLSSTDWRVINFAIDRLRTATEDQPDLPADVSETLAHISKVSQVLMAA